MADSRTAPWAVTRAAAGGPPIPDEIQALAADTLEAGTLTDTLIAWVVLGHQWYTGRGSDRLFLRDPADDGTAAMLADGMLQIAAAVPTLAALQTERRLHTRRPYSTDGTAMLALMRWLAAQRLFTKLTYEFEPGAGTWAYVDDQGWADARPLYQGHAPDPPLAVCRAAWNAACDHGRYGRDWTAPDGTGAPEAADGD